MVDAVSFILASLALLATPGPTNTLLATSGAAAGLRRSLHLILAEQVGYGISILTLALLILPMVDELPAVSLGLRLSCGAYLVWSAVQLWREGAGKLALDEPVPFHRVFTATLLNPKGVIFAFAVIPYLKDGQVIPALPYLAGLSTLMVVVALAWIGTGAAVRAAGEGRLDGGVIRKVGASVLAMFGVLLSASAIQAWK